MELAAVMGSTTAETKPNAHTLWPSVPGRGHSSLGGRRGGSSQSIVADPHERGGDGEGIEELVGGGGVFLHRAEAEGSGGALATTTDNKRLLGESSYYGSLLVPPPPPPPVPGLPPSIGGGNAAGVSSGATASPTLLSSGGHRPQITGQNNISNDSDSQQLAIVRASASTAQSRRGGGSADKGQQQHPLLLYQQNPRWELVDALPYVDPISAEVEEEVKSLVEDELVAILRENGGEVKDYLTALPLPPTPHLDSDTSMAAAELRRIAEGRRSEGLDFSSYNGADPPEGVRAGDPLEWRRHSERLQLLSEYSADSALNLQLMNKYSQRSWFRHISELQQMATGIARDVKAKKEEVEAVNKRRKLDQMEGGNALRTLSRTREELVEKNSLILSALSELEAEVAALKKKCRAKKVLPAGLSDFDDEKTEDQLYYVEEIDDDSFCEASEEADEQGRANGH